MICYSFVLLINYLSGIYSHDFHVSVANIEFDKTEQALEISQRIFIDDLELVLSQINDSTKIDIIQDFDEEITKKSIKNYVLSQINISANGKVAELNYLGAKLDGDVIVVFIESPNIKKLKSIMVKNTIFMESFPDQINLIHVLVDKKNRSMKLDLGKPSDTFEY